jgi:hypothetical protein
MFNICVVHNVKKEKRLEQMFRAFLSRERTVIIMNHNTTYIKDHFVIFSRESDISQGLVDS